tara:strand:+ start:501 stop:1010 length:510 start_codon:yes stop_codon:yes gene_type:complete
MFNRIMSVILSLSICMNTVFAQEIKTEDAWDLSDTPMVWSPQKKKLKFGELEIEVWVLPQPRMTAPDAGYLLFRSDVSQLLERMNNAKGRIDEVIQEERYACDIQLKEKDASCIRQQEQLQFKFDEQVKTIKRLNGDVDDKDDTIFYWQLGAGGATILALSFGLFAIAK